MLERRAPGWVTNLEAAKFPNLAASYAEAPVESADRQAPAYMSPAPLVSTASTGLVLTWY